MTEEEIYREMTHLSDFGDSLKRLRLAFPEHAREIDKCYFEVGQKLNPCDEPDCECRMDFETFHEQMNANAGS